VTDTRPQAEKRPPRQEQEAASEEVVEVAPGVLRMQLPIWMPGLGHVNMYGLVDDRGLTVVDPGLPGPQSWKALKQRLKTAGYSLKNVHTVLVTHSHPDHFGGAGRIARENGAQLITHHAFSTWTVKGPSPHRALTEGEAKRAEVEAAAYSQAVDVEPDEIPTINDDADVVHDDTEETEPTSSPWGAITPWGSRNPGPPLKRKLMIRAMRMLFTPPEPTERVHHGDRLRIGAGEWFAVHTPVTRRPHLRVEPRDRHAAHRRPRVAVDHAARFGRPPRRLAQVVPGDARSRRPLDGVKLGLPAHGQSLHRRPGRVRRSRSTTRSAWSCCATRRSRSARDGSAISRTRSSRSATGARWPRARPSPTSSTWCTRHGRALGRRRRLHYRVRGIMMPTTRPIAKESAICSRS
jgi:glyoxylase-like metal-dependent hydrolase (beta-lactamase superfamily II)